MKKFALIVVLLLLVGGGGGGYWFMFMHGQKPAEPEPPPVPTEQFLRLERFVVPLVHDGIVDGFSRIEVTLDIVDFDTRKDIERDVPKLRNAIISDLHALLPLRRTGAVAGAQETDALKKRLMAIVERQVGPNKVKALYLEEYIDVAPYETRAPRG